jgi:hypothetical protein
VSRPLPPLDREQFRAWLQAQETTEIVGWPGDAAACPLAFWLIRGFGLREVEVRSGTYGDATPEDGGRWAATPEWAERFIRRVDALATPGGERPVLAAQALALLEETP